MIKFQSYSKCQVSVERTVSGSESKAMGCPGSIVTEGNILSLDFFGFSRSKDKNASIVYLWKTRLCAVRINNHKKKCYFLRVLFYQMKRLEVSNIHRNCKIRSGGSKGRGREGCVPPWIQILSISCIFWVNLTKSYVGTQWGVGAPSSGKSWSATDTHITI